MKPKETMYARNEEQAQAWMDEYLLDHDHIFKKTAQCVCGESMAYYYYDGASEQPQTCIIICEGCHDTAAMHERI